MSTQKRNQLREIIIMEYERLTVKQEVQLIRLCKEFQPYFQAKLGANYAEEYTYLPTMAFKDSQWGFYVSPEIGFTWHPFHKSNFGFQLAAYYSYATNRSRAFGIDGINNVGFKLGVSF